MDFMIEKLLGFVMVLTRISAFFLIIPVFGWQSIPMRIKTAMTVLITVFILTIKPELSSFSNTHPLEAGIMLCYEAMYGFGLGLIAAVVFSSVKVSGRIVERQMGMAMAQIMDPLTGERAQPVGMILEMIFIILFLSVNGHHMFLLAISKSYDSFPPGSVPSVPLMLDAAIQSGSAMLVASLRLAAPILAAFIVLMVSMAVLARIAPEMNILFISMPLRVGLGMLMLAVFLPFFNTFVAEFSTLMNRLLPL